MKTKEQLAEVLKLHRMWLNHEDGGKHANLSNANLSRADLSMADLRGANLIGASLIGANLIGADLRNANLSNANLSRADLSMADLSRADLRMADLRMADLSRANLSRADLRGANLIGADLRRAYIPMFCKWFTAIRDNKIIIGCKEKTPEEWNEWLNSDEEFSTKRGTPEFKQIEAVIRAYIAYFKVLND